MILGIATPATADARLNLHDG